MPGGRLTQQERHQISVGLADGLAYAEIARRLDRPTSTVTREVMRNGGPAAYRADLAQHATEHRTHRRKPAATPRGGTASALPYGRDAEAVREYEEAWTEILMRQGMPKMTSRVLASLYVTDSGSLTAAELVRRLQVSPAAISKAVSFLEGLNLLRREQGEGRRERYIVDPELWYHSTVASARANDDLIKVARRANAVLGADTPAARRLENTARFLDFVSEGLLRAAEQAREVLRVPSAADGGAPGPDGTPPG